MFFNVDFLDVPFSRFKKVTQPISKAKRFCKAHRELFHKVFLGILCLGRSFTLRSKMMIT